MTRPWLALVPGLAGIALAAPLGAASPVIHYPPDGLVVTGGGMIHVVVEAKEPPGMEARWNGTVMPLGVMARRASGETVVHVPVRLEPGANTIQITLNADRVSSARVSRNIFFLSQIGGQPDPPPGFRRQPFHQGTARETACGGCHEMRARPEDTGPATPERSTCFSCHRRIAIGQEVHGPAALWVCTRCHDPDGSPARYATPDPVMPLCFSCHAEQKERLDRSRHQHGPAATGLCTICHDPHATEHRFFLKRAAWDLCTTCHAEKASGRHVVAWGPLGQTHPTRGRPDPSSPGREISCASCHNPHAAASAKLWNFGATFYLDLCRNCHARILGG